MRAMVLHRPAPAETLPLQSEERTLPVPGPGQVLIRIRACGVCHTDLHIVEGDLAAPSLPLIPGHQVAGVIEAVGPDTAHFSPGDRVGLPWMHHTCGICPACLSGRENLCTMARHTGFHVDGGFAEYMVAETSFLCRLPDSFDDSQAAPLLCAGVIGHRALRLCGPPPRDGALGLFGFGASAHLTLQVARHMGWRVFAFSRGSRRRERALELGAEWAGQTGERPPCHLSAGIVFAPAGEVVPPALETLERGGTLALAGIWMSPIPPLDYSRHLYHERCLRSVANATRQDAQELLALAPRIPLRIDVARFPLERANEAILALKTGGLDRASAVLEISPPT